MLFEKKKHQTYGKCNKISHVQMFPVCFTAPRNHFQNGLHRSPTGHGGRELKQNRACMWIFTIFVNLLQHHGFTL